MRRVEDRSVAFDGGDADLGGPRFAQPFVEGAIHLGQLFGVGERPLRCPGLPVQPVGKFASV